MGESRAVGAGWRFEPGDIESALNAATQIGDDTLQRKARGTVVPESFTHGTSEQRVSWLKKGLDTGDLNACDTFGEGHVGPAKLMGSEVQPVGAASAARPGDFRNVPLERDDLNDS